MSVGGATAQAVKMPAGGEAAIQPLRISGFVVHRRDLVGALRVYVPSLADVRVTDDGEHFWLVLSEGGDDDQAPRKEAGAGEGGRGPEEQPDTTSPALERRMGQRQFLKMLGAAAGLAGLAGAGQVVIAPQKAEAADETVSGNLMVTGSASIGTASAPWQRLTVVGGNVYVDNSAQWTPYVQLIGTYPTPDMGVGLAVDSDAFYIKTGDAGAETMRITVRRTGNVGIGTYSPAVALDVLGDIQASSNLKMNGVVAIGSDAVAKQTYYAP